MRHREVGLIECDYEALLSPAEDQRPPAFTPPPGSPRAAALDLPHVLGPETAHRGHR